MANYFVTYDLNGSTPSHKRVDEVLERLGATRGRVLETVWYVGYYGSASSLFEAVNAIFSNNDQLLVIDARDIVWRNLLITDESIQQSWAANA